MDDLIERARDAAAHSREFGPGTNAPLLDALAAEIETLRAEVERLEEIVGGPVQTYDMLKARAERLEEALRMIAAPMRFDGSWNRDREACRQIAYDALIDHDQEVSNG